MEYWQEGKGLIACSEHLFDTGLHSDVTFHVGENREEVKGHKMLLAMRSPVFEIMFYGAMAQEGTQPIHIEELQPEDFKTVLKYIYTDNISLTEENKYAICRISQKYLLAELLERCIQYLACSLTVDNFPNTLNLATFLSLDHLKARCLQFLQQFTDKVIAHTDVEDLSKESLRAVLSVDHVSGVSEMDLYLLAERWAKHKIQEKDAQCQEDERGEENADADECSEKSMPKKIKLDEQITYERSDEEVEEISGLEIRNFLDDFKLVNLIRFPCIAYETFVEHFTNTDILNDAERLRVYEARHKKQNEDGSFDTSSGMFMTRSRYQSKQGEISIQISHILETPKLFGRRSDLFTGGKKTLFIRMNKDVWLAGVSMNGYSSQYEYETGRVCLTVKDKHGNLLQRNTRNFKAKYGCDTIGTLRLRTPLLITADTDFLVEVDLLKESTIQLKQRKIRKGKLTCDQNNVNVMVKEGTNEDMSFSNTEHEYTLIRDLVLFKYEDI